MINIDGSVVDDAKLRRCKRTVKFYKLTTRIFHGSQYIKSQKIPIVIQVLRNRAMLPLVNNFLFFSKEIYHCSYCL